MTTIAPPRPGIGSDRERPTVAARLGGRLARLTLLQRLLALEGVIFILLLVSTVIVANVYAGGLRRRINDERLVLTRSFAGHFDEIIEDGFHELRSAARASAGASDDVAQRELDFLVTAGIFARGAVVVDAAGRVTTADRAHPELVGISLNEQLAAAAERPDGGRGWGFQLAAGQGPTLALAQPWSVPGATAHAGDPRYVVGFIDPQQSNVSRLLQRAVDVGETAHAEVVTPDGISMASTEEAHLLVTSDHPAYYARRLTEGLPDGTYRVAHQDHSDTAHGMGNEDHIMAFVSLESLPWVFALGGTVSATYAPVQQLWLSVWALIGVVGMAALTITVIGVRKLVEPVRTLSEAARRVAGGELETPIAITAGGEIGELGKSVETMRQFLYDWGVELDRRVGERTAEIARRNRELFASTAVAQVAASTLEVGPMLREAAQQIEQTFDAAGVIVYIPERDGRPAEQQASDGAGELHAATTTLMDCDACVALDGGQPAVMHSAADPANDTLPACIQTFLRARPSAALLRAPIHLGEDRVGTLCIFYKNPGQEGTPTLEPLPLLTSAIALGVRNADLYENLRQREGQARLLLGKVLNAQEEERARVARELHDDTGQALTGIMFGLDAMQRVGAAHPEQQLEQLSRLRTIVSESIENLRRMILALRPPALDDLGLVAAIQRYADLHVRSARTVVEVHSGLAAERLQLDSEVLIFRVIQEALNNVVRHSEATRVLVSLERAEGQLRAGVTDNGKGFITRAGTWRTSAVGLAGMNERAEMLGGRLTVESAPGRGTIVRLVVPESLVLERGQPA